MPEDATDYSQVGRYVEFLVCAELTKLGYFVTHCDAPGFDILLVADGKPFRVQVKSSHKVEDGRCIWRTRVTMTGTGKQRIKRPLTKADADIVALYHCQFDRMIFAPISKCSTGIVDLPISQVRAADTMKTLQAALKA